MTALQNKCLLLLGAINQATSIDTSLDSQTVVDELNAAFNGFDPANASSPLGVTIRWSMEFKFWCGEGCVHNYSDCRASAALYNHRIAWQSTYVNPPFWFGAESMGGMIFKPQSVETELAKCAYMVDGDTAYRYNSGCGCTGCGYEGGPPCTNASRWGSTPCASADPKTGNPFTARSPAVATCHCGKDPSPEGHDTGACYFRGPAFYGSHTESELRRFVANRVRHNFTDFENAFTEVVLDAGVINQQLAKDVTSVLSAFFIVTSGSSSDKACDETCKENVRAMQNQVYKDYNVRVPIVGVNTGARLDPFLVVSDSQGASAEIIV